MQAIHNNCMLLTCLVNAEAVMYHFQITLLCQHKDIGTGDVLTPVNFHPDERGKEHKYANQCM